MTQLLLGHGQRAEIDNRKTRNGRDFGVRIAPAGGRWPVRERCCRSGLHGIFDLDWFAQKRAEGRILCCRWFDFQNEAVGMAVGSSYANPSLACLFHVRLAFCTHVAVSGRHFILCFLSPSYRLQ